VKFIKHVCLGLQSFGRHDKTFGRQHNINMCATTRSGDISGMFGRKLLDLLATKRISDSNMLRNVIQLTSVDVWRCNVKESYHTKSHIRKLLNIMNVPHMSAKRLGAHMLISCCRPNFLIFAQTSCRPKRLHTYVCALFLHIDARLI